MNLLEKCYHLALKRVLNNINNSFNFQNLTELYLKPRMYYK